MRTLIRCKDEPTYLSIWNSSYFRNLKRKKKVRGYEEGQEKGKHADLSGGLQDDEID
jgi:hypothetical protein